MFLEDNMYMKLYEVKQKFNNSSLFPILNAEKLLAGPKHVQLLNKLQNLLAISPNHYDVLYGSLIHNFAEFVQVLPLGESGRIASVLNEGLEHALVAVQMLSESGITKNDQLLTYAVFSAALLQDIGKVVINRTIMISDRTGAFIHEWFAHGQPMSKSVGSHFKIRYTKDAPLRMSSRVTPIFARQLMPEIGYTWIAKNPTILTMWLAALGDSTDDDSGTVGIKLDLALRKLKTEQHEHLPEVIVEITDPKETRNAEAFLAWLIEGLQSQSDDFQVDKAGASIESVAGGLLLHSKLFKKFSTIKGGDWIVLKTEFNHLGLTPLSGKDKIIEKYFSHPTESNHMQLTDKAKDFHYSENSHTSYLAKQFHSLTGGTHHTTTSHAHAEAMDELVIISERFLPDLSSVGITLRPNPGTAEEYLEREMRYLEEQPNPYIAFKPEGNR